MKIVFIVQPLCRMCGSFLRYEMSDVGMRRGHIVVWDCERCGVPGRTFRVPIKQAAGVLEETRRIEA